VLSLPTDGVGCYPSGPLYFQGLTQHKKIDDVPNRLQSNAPVCNQVCAAYLEAVRTCNFRRSH
jgi:hypothetical protein